MPRNKHPEETIQKILDVSLQLFVEKGFEQTTVLDIVENLGGLTRGAFYHHFKSKEEVLEAIFQKRHSVSDPFADAMQANVANGLERVQLALKLGLRKNTINEHNTALTSLVVSLLSNPRFLVQHIQGIQETATHLAPLIAEGMADGSIPPGNPRMLAELFFLLVNFWMIPAIFPCTEEEMMTKGELLDKVLHAIDFPITDNEMEALFTQTLDAMEPNIT